MDFLIQEGVLKRCVNAEKNIVVPDGVVSIEEDAFMCAGSLESITLPESMERFGKNAFRYISIENLIISKNVKAMAFNSSYTIKNVTIDENNSFYCTVEGIVYNKEQTEMVFVPNGISGIITVPETVRRIPDYAFASNGNITDVILPNSVTEMGDYAFYRTKIKSIVLPDSLKEVPPCAFLGCEELERIELPKHLKKISAQAFEGCSHLFKINIPDSVSEIGIQAFKDCESLCQVNLPHNLEVIGERAFQYCKELKELVGINKDVCIGTWAFYGCDSLTDRNGCIVFNSELHYYAEQKMGYGNTANISEGVEVIKAGALRARNIHFPDSLRKIESNDIGDGTDSNIPHRFLEQKEKADAEMICRLLKSTSWKANLTARDYAALMMFQKRKTINIELEHCKISERKNEILSAMCELLREKGEGAHFQIAAEYYFANKSLIDQKIVNELYELSVSARAKKTAELLEPYITKNVASSDTKGNLKEETEESIIDYCKRYYVPFAMDKYISKNKIKESVLSNVKFKDSEKLAPVFVVECAIVPYMQQYKGEHISIREYKNDYYEFKFDPVADKIADALDKDSFRAMLDALIGKGLPSPKEAVIPYGRYASGNQITALGKRLKTWGNWDPYATRGREATIFAHGAILLNDSREALLMADEIGHLPEAAEIRNLTEDYVRDMMLSDFSFDAQGKRRFDLGGTTVKLSLLDDMSLHIYDSETGKEVKSLSQKGNDEEKLILAGAEIQEIKKNIGDVARNRIETLKKEFVRYTVHDVLDWKTAYMNNPILRKIGKEIVWSLSDEDRNRIDEFMMQEDGEFINADGTIIDLPEKTKVSVAHPVTMKSEDIKKWRMYLTNHSIVQPFVQMFESVCPSDKNKLKDRYRGIKLQYSLLKELEKEGFEIDGDYENGFEAKFDENSLGFSIKSRDIYSIKRIPMDEQITFYSFETYANPKSRNHAIYLLDGICLEPFVADNNIDALIGISSRITEKNILHLIDIASENQSTDCLAWLLNYKNDHFKYEVDKFGV